MKINSSRCVWLLLSCLLVVPTDRLLAAPGDEHWSPEFGVPGTATLPHVILNYKNRLYVGGEGSSTNTTLRVWDGAQWSDIGVFTGSFPSVYDVAWVGNTLYAAGVFTNVDGVTVKGLARWNGSGWSDMGLTGYAYALAVNGPDLYVGGGFTNVAGVGATNVARWNGSSWSTVGAGVGNPGNFVLSLVFDGGNLYAGGSFTNSGPLGTTNIARWNGSSWTNLGSGLGTQIFPDRVYAMTMKDGNLYAGGIFTNSGPLAVNAIARWDGANWSPLGTGVAGTVLSVASFNGLLCVGGQFNAAGGAMATNFATWNGATWSGAGGGLSGSCFRVQNNGTNLLLGGSFSLADNKYVNQIATWDGASFGQVGPAGRMNGVSSLVRALAHDGTNLFAGGGFAYAGPTNALNVGRFDGTNWSAMAGGLNNTVLAIATIGTNVYAGGNFTSIPGGSSASHLARWNGSGWSPLPGFSSTAVNALAKRGHDLFVGGYFSIATADGSSSWLARWDGTNFWKAMAFDSNTFNLFALDNTGFTAVAADDNYVYASGNCSITPCDDTWTFCTNSRNVMRFDGTYMRGMGTGLSSNANAIAVMGTNVYFGGPFTNAGGVITKGIARWDGQAWSDVGGGIIGTGNISALAVMGTNLYAGGTFTNIGGTPAKRIARWNGSSWAALGSGTAFSATAGPVSALAVTGSDLYVGGTFKTAGTRQANYIARWNEGMNFDEVFLRLSRITNSPASSFGFTITATGVPVYIIERSTDFVAWAPVLTNSYTPYDHVDTNSPANPRGFYRARSRP